MATRSAQGHHRQRRIAHIEALEPRAVMTAGLDSMLPLGTLSAVDGGSSRAWEIAPAAAAMMDEHEHDEAIHADDPTAPFIHLQHDTIPNFVQTPTNVATRSGAWSDPRIWSAGRVPGPGDVVQIRSGAVVEYALVSDAPIRALGVNPGATLRFSRTANTRLTVGTLIVFERGALLIGGAEGVATKAKAEVVFANYALDLMSDPKQYGNGMLVFGKIEVNGAEKNRTWVELKYEALAGQSYIDLAEPVSGWRSGDRILLPDSRQIPTHMSDTFDNGATGILPPAWEEAQIKFILGSRIYLEAPLRYHHVGGRNAQDNLETLPHVALLDRNVVFRSQVPEGTRGHVLIGGRADADIRYARFESLGRTSALSDLDSTTTDATGRATYIGLNQVGRYSLHLHHLVGPMNMTNTGYQFQMIGNTIDNGRKWGMALHGTSFGNVQDNVIYMMQGSAFVTEDGTEIDNRFVRNFAARIVGTGIEDTRDMTDTGRAGTGFWLRRAGNYFEDNVVADASFAGMVINGYASSKNLVAPAFRGALVSMPGQSVPLVVSKPTTISGLEAYGRMRHGVWMAFPTGNSREDSRIVVEDLTAWHTHDSAVRAYHMTGLTIEDALILGDRYNLGIARASQSRPSAGMNFISYEMNNLVIRNARIENHHVGIRTPDQLSAIDTPGVALGPTLIENSSLANFTNIEVGTAKFSGAGAQPKTVLIRDTLFSHVSTYGMRYLPKEQHHIEMVYADKLETRDLMTPHTVLVENFNRMPGDSFQVYYLQQAPAFIPPRLTTGLGSPRAGYSNFRLWGRYGVALAGAVAPSLSQRSGILGYVHPRPAAADALVDVAAAARAAVDAALATDDRLLW